MSPVFKSILARIVFLQLVAFGALILALFLAAYLLVDAPSVRFESRPLSAHADRIAQYLSVRPDGSVALKLPADLRSYYAEGLGGFAYAVTDDGGKVLFSSRPSGKPLLAKNRSTKTPIYSQSPNKESSYLSLALPTQVGSRHVWVQIRRAVRQPGMITVDVLAHFLQRIGWFAVPIVLLLLLTNFFVVRNVLRPVVAASRQARAIDPRRLDVRLPTRNLPGEVVPLVETVNQALGRLESGFRMQREFTADAAHELRTPLSVLRLRIDNLADRAVAKSLKADLDVMSHVVDQLLSVAELEGLSVAPGETADLHRVASDVLELIAPMALAQQRDVALTGCETPVPVAGSAPMLFQAVRNLVENAVRHTGPGTTVEVRIEPDGVLRVLDEGPGVPQEMRTLIFRRFWRRDHSRSGAGLGLAIVARVADLHGGSVSVDDRAGGGAMFTLDLRGAKSRLRAPQTESPTSDPVPSLH